MTFSILESGLISDYPEIDCHDERVRLTDDLHPTVGDNTVQMAYKPRYCCYGIR
jgi:hypothetical protein